jgi:hypothetical protein
MTIMVMILFVASCWLLVLVAGGLTENGFVDGLIDSSDWTKAEKPEKRTHEGRLLSRKVSSKRCQRTTTMMNDDD